MKLLGVLSLALLLLASCSKDKNNPGYAYMGEFDMYYSVPYNTYTPNPVFSDSLTNQLPVAGTIPRGALPYPYLSDNIGQRAQYQILAGQELKNPLQPTDAVLEHGKQQYNIYCISCHGERGKGDGHLYTSGLYPAKPTSLVDAYVKGKADGEIYHVITAGSISGLMGPHGSQITPENRWKIVHYVRSLGK